MHHYPQNEKPAQRRSFRLGPEFRCRHPQPEGVDVHDQRWGSEQKKLGQKSADRKKGPAERGRVKNRQKCQDTFQHFCLTILAQVKNCQYQRKTKRGNSGEGKTYHKTPPQNGFGPPYL